MNRTLRLLTLLALPVFVLGLSGCGEEKPVQLGAVLPLSGAAEIYGTPVNRGIQLAFEQIQADETYPYEVELVTRDSESDPEKARTILKELFENKVLAAIGGVTSEEAIKMVEVADEYDQILLSPSASSPELTSVSKNFFRVFPSDFLEGNKMGNFATQTLGVETVVILAAETLYGRGSQEIFKTEFERYDGEVLEVIEYPEGTEDFSGLMDRVMTLKPQAVYLADFAGPLGEMVRALKARNFQGRILTTSAFAAPEVLEALEGRADGVYLTLPVFEATSEDPLISNFVTAYQEKYGELPGLYAAHGYDAMIVLLEALRKIDRPTASEMWKGMKQIQNFSGVTGVIQFDERGDVQKFPRVYTVNQGELVDYDSFVEGKRREILDRLNRLKSNSRGGGEG